MIDKNEEQVINKPRNGFVALILSILLPGLGQLYNGKIKKGLILFILYSLVLFFFVLIKVTTTFEGLIIFLIILLPYLLYIQIDSVVGAIKQKKYILKNYNKWYIYLVLIFIFQILINENYNIMDFLGTKSFVQPSNCNEPTIFPNDRIVVDLNAYNNDDPDYGDLIVFWDANKELWYCYRIVGLPNDNLQLKDNFVFKEGSEVKAKHIWDDIYEEELPNGYKHKIRKMKEPFKYEVANREYIKVPEDSYYVLGDNRDMSSDSRFIGSIHKDRIVGKLKYIYWSESTERIGMDLTNK